jgi:hypothetical protein
MLRKELKIIAAISILSSAFLFNACTPQERAFATGVGVGAVVASAYNYPYYYDRPYYFYNNMYYYGGVYRDGYYIYRGQRFRNGHYYHSGYRYYNGKRYPVRVGTYGYYKNKDQYRNRDRYKKQLNNQRRNRDNDRYYR